LVAKEDDFTDLLDGREVQAVVRGPWEVSVRDETRSLRVADKERGDDELQFVDETGSQELRVHRLATFDHKALNSPRSKVGQDPVDVERFSSIDDDCRRIVGEQLSCLRDYGTGAVDELFHVASRKE